MKNIKGITLISLVITIIVLLILASIATYSGMDTIKSSKFTAFSTELKIMQTQVNNIYQKYKDNETITIEDTSYYGEGQKDNEENKLTILEIGEEIAGDIKTQADNVFTKLQSDSITGITTQDGYLYWSKDLIKKLGIEGVEGDFFVNVEKRSVISYEGFAYDGKTYYMVNQLPDGLYNVDYQNANTGKPTFDVNYQKIGENKWKITISNIQYDKYIDKWQVKYQLEGKEYWNTTEDFSFVVKEKGIYNITINNQDIISDEKKIAVEVAEPEPASSEDTELSQMLYGVIEVEFLNETGYEVEESNKPILRDGMKAVYWAKDSSGELDLSNPANNTYEITSDDANFKEENWYAYIAQIGSEDGKTSRWANAMTSDGSYYVWIPRYAYRIIYFDTQDNENAYREGTLTEEAALEAGNIVGYSDARGIVDKNGKRPTEVTSSTAISVNEKYFRTHPVFDGNTDEGGWDSKLTGIWVMKYEASRDDATATVAGSGTIPKSVPSVKSWTGINVSTMFTYARDAYNKDGELNTTLNSHMIKNSEWGAIAYLAESKYGRNGTEISVNQCSDMITGTGRGVGDNAIYNSNYAWSSITDEQKYTGTVGQLSSTTGNIYGIYDISGGSNEYVMGFYGTVENTSTFGNSGFTAETFPSEKKYYQIYQKTTSDGRELGEALYETKGWNGDAAYFVNSDKPVLRRGGGYKDEGQTGAYFFSIELGGRNSGERFRVCLAIK